MWPSRSLPLCLLLAGCHHTAPLGSQPIPLPDRPPWRVLLGDSTFRIAMDTRDVQRGPEHTWWVWFITSHAHPRRTEGDSLGFDRGRMRLLVRCAPLAFKSVSEELALGDAPPLFEKRWPVSGSDSAVWRAPEPESTDGRFLHAACRWLEPNG
jgi:hypothetical protein